VASRRLADELISQGRVVVNGKVVSELGAKADPERDHIKVDDRRFEVHRREAVLPAAQAARRHEHAIGSAASPDGHRIAAESLA